MRIISISRLVLTADEIIMEEDSVLGPVDPQIKDIPAGSLISLLNKKPIGTISDENIMLSDIARKSLVRVIKLVEWLLEDRMEREKAQDVADFLTGGYITHSTPITFEVAKEFGLQVKKGVPDNVYNLFRTFEFGACPRPQYAKY